jgi:hypothetical protein
MTLYSNAPQIIPNQRMNSGNAMNQQNMGEKKLTIKKTFGYQPNVGYPYPQPNIRCTRAVKSKSELILFLGNYN